MLLKAADKMFPLHLFLSDTSILGKKNYELWQKVLNTFENNVNQKVSG